MITTSASAIFHFFCCFVSLSIIKSHPVWFHSFSSSLNSEVSGSTQKGWAALLEQPSVLFQISGMIEKTFIKLSKDRERKSSVIKQLQRQQGNLWRRRHRTNPPLLSTNTKSALLPLANAAVQVSFQYLPTSHYQKVSNSGKGRIV